MKKLKYLFWGLLLSMHLPLGANELTFSCQEQADQYHTLLKEIRCVTCPNQSIADSQASVARAMQEEIYRRLQQGDSPDTIRDFLLDTYGDYVMYRPLMKQQNYLLWFGPTILLLLGIGSWAYFVNKRGSTGDS